MELDNLKNAWQNLNVRVDRLEEENRRTTEALSRNRAKSAQMRLADSYKRTAVLGFALPAIAPMCVRVLHMPVWVGVMYALFGLIMGALVLRAYWVTKHTNFMSLSVVDALRQAIRLRRRQNITTTTGIVLGCVLIGVFYSYLKVGVWGFFIGLAVGLAIGIRKQLRQRELIREIEDALRE
ncbi:MAG: hypothetical protein HDS72_09590 [Bacteroidales bacterium]|nr:hypothetical protein [Bacteroidales bacterium]